MQTLCLTVCKERSRPINSSIGFVSIMLSSSMPRRLISTGSPFEKTFGYSRAVVDGDFVFVSGTTGYDYATMKMPGSIEEQTRNCFATISAVLAEAGFRLADVVRATYYIVDHAAADRALA